MSDKKPILQVCLIHGGAKCYWLTPNDKPFGTQRYHHPDCQIFFKGARSHQTDHAVMLALQQVDMAAGSLRYYRGGSK